MNPVKRIRIHNAIEKYKEFKKEIDEIRLDREVKRLMNRPWPFKIKTVELAKEKILKDTNFMMSTYKIWAIDTISNALEIKMNVVEANEIFLNDEEIDFVGRYETIYLKGEMNGRNK